MWVCGNRDIVESSGARYALYLMIFKKREGYFEDKGRLRGTWNPRNYALTGRQLIHYNIYYKMQLSISIRSSPSLIYIDIGKSHIYLDYLDHLINFWEH